MSAHYHIKNLFAGLLTLGVLAGCGYAEWPPRDSNLRDVNRATPQVTQNNDARFVSASAVMVGKGDTVYALSKRHKVPMRAIIEANGLIAPFILHIGQRIELPRGGTAHKIVRGDTLFGIANAYDVNAFELARINGLKPPYVIHVGNSLILPSGTNPSPKVEKAQRSTGSSPAKSTAIAPSKAETKTAAPAKPKPVVKPAWVSPPIVKAKDTKKPVPAAPRKALVAPPAKSQKGFLWPVNGKVISNYGVKSKGLRNDGINIQARRGHPVKAAENGIVAYAGNELRGFGNLLLIKHAGGYVTAYAHNEQLLVKRGDKIKRGQKIATIGSTGNVSSPQLHFEIRRGNKARDPKKYLRGKA